MALDMERDRMNEGLSDRTLGERIMFFMRQMNYNDLVGDARLKGIELAEKAKLLSWSRSRPGEHDDKHTNEELLEAIQGMAQEFARLHDESDNVVTTRAEAYQESLDIHHKAVEAEEERRLKGERPPLEDFHPHPAPTA